MDIPNNSNPPQAPAPQPAPSSPEQAVGSPAPAKPKMSKKFWLLVTLVPIGLLLIAFLIIVIVITTCKSPTINVSNTKIAPSASRGFLHNEYANGAHEVTIESKDGNPRRLHGSSSDFAHLAVMNQSGAFGLKPNTLEIRNASDGKVEHSVPLIEECSIVIEGDFLFCTVQSNDGKSRSLAKLAVSNGETVDAGIPLAEITNGASSANGGEVASFYTNMIDYIHTFEDKQVVVVGQWAGIGTSPHSYLALINKDGSLNYSLPLENYSIGSYCAPVRQGGSIACTESAADTYTMTTVDLQSRDVQFIDDIAQQGETVTITDDGWIVDSQFVGIQGVSIGGSDLSEMNVEIFDLKGKSVTKAHRALSISPDGQFDNRSQTVYSKAEQFIDREENYTSRLIVNSEGAIVAQGVYGSGGSDMFEVTATGKTIDGYVHYVSRNGNVLLTSANQLQTRDLRLVSADGTQIQSIALEQELADMYVINGLMYSDEGYADDQRVTVFIPKKN